MDLNILAMKINARIDLPLNAKILAIHLSAVIEEMNVNLTLSIYCLHSTQRTELKKIVSHTVHCQISIGVFRI